MPAENSYELEYISDITIIPLSHFQQIVDFLLKGTGLAHLRNAKTLLSKALPTILPPLDTSEILEVSQIYSVVGKLNKDLPLVIQRPFRQVHHTASKVSII